MAASRSALEFMERAGIVVVQNPGPRLSVTDLRVQQLPLVRPEPAQAVRLAYEGAPPHDRGAAKPWPNQEVGQ